MATPTLKRSWGFVGLGGLQPDTGNNFKIRLEASGTPAAVSAGDLIVCAVACQNSVTPTVSDDKSNTWATAVTVSNTTLATPRKYTIFYAVNAAANTSLITVGFGGLTTNVQIDVALFYNTITSSPLDGTVATTGIVPANNTAPNIQPGNLTTTVDGDLIFNVIYDEGDGTLGDNNPVSSVTFGSGFSGLHSEQLAFFHAMQYQVQGTHGAINPGMTFAQTTHDSFASLAAAFKAGTGGAAPGSGIRIIRSSMQYLQQVANSTQLATLSTDGNLIVVVAENDNATATGLSSVTDPTNGTYTHVTKGPAGTPDTFFAANVTAQSSLTLSLKTPSTSNGPSLVGIFDIAGAATSPLDTGATAANSSTITGTNSGATYRQSSQSSPGTDVTDAPSIVPSTSNGLVLAAINLGTGPTNDSISFTDDFPFATWNSGGGDANAFINGDGISHVFNTNATTQNFGYHTSNTTPPGGTAWNAMATAFKAAPIVSVSMAGWLPDMAYPSTTNIVSGY